MHEERFELGEETAHAVNEAKASGRRVIAVGTTTVRVLESVAAQNGGKLVKNCRKNGHFHPSAVPVSNRGRAADEFSFAALHAA